MKKMFLFAAMASVAFASCTTDEKFFDGTDESNEIRFTAAQYSVQSRGEHDPDVAFTEDVTIWSWYDGKGVDGDKNYTVIPGDNYNSSYENSDGTKGGFTSNNKYYWPVDGTALDFVAVPTELVGTKYFTAPTRDAAGNTKLEFKIAAADEYHSTVNLMTTEVQTANNGTVALLFRHLLSKVNIKVSQHVRENDDARWTVTVNSIKVSGLNDVGSVAIDDKWVAKNASDEAKYWDEVSGSEDWEVLTSAHELYTNGVTDAAAVQNDFKSAETYYMLPQKLEAGSQKITINYTVVTEYLGNPTQPHTTKTYSETFALKDVATIKAWAMNKIITYNILINPTETINQIAFTVKEEEWGKGTDSKEI